MEGKKERRVGNSRQAGNPKESLGEGKKEGK